MLSPKRVSCGSPRTRTTRTILWAGFGASILPNLRTHERHFLCFVFFFSLHFPIYYVIHKHGGLVVRGRDFTMLLFSVTVQHSRGKAPRKHGVLRVRFILFFFVVPLSKSTMGSWERVSGWGWRKHGKGYVRGWDTQLFKTTTCHLKSFFLLLCPISLTIFYLFSFLA